MGLILWAAAAGFYLLCAHDANVAEVIAGLPLTLALTAAAIALYQGSHRR